jgi:hypothetical protein
LGDFFEQESRAARIAADLVRGWGDQALDRAKTHLQGAETAGHFARIDLFRAVCTIIVDRDRVFSRSRTAATSLHALRTQPLTLPDPIDRPDL